MSARLIGDLIIARDAALSASASKSAFVANMSHELRTPLNAIIGYAELLHEESSDASTSRDLDRIIVSSRHLLSLVNDILDLSKLGAGRMVPQDEAVSPATIIGEVIWDDAALGRAAAILCDDLRCVEVAPMRFQPGVQRLQVRQEWSGGGEIAARTSRRVRVYN